VGDFDESLFSLIPLPLCAHHAPIVPLIRISTSNVVAHHPLQPKRGKISMDEEGDPRRRRESFLHWNFFQLTYFTHSK